MSKSIVTVVFVSALFALTALAFTAAPGAAPADPQADASYIGADSCKKCHFKEHKTWTAMKHANAWASLAEKYRDPAQVDENGRACISCHTTGYGHGDKGGFVDAASTPGMVNVGCEACHGPGSLHAEAGKALMAEKRKSFNEGEERFITRVSTNCTQCHNPHINHDQYKEG
ncbi:MAG: hypothetical protein H6825_11245 [Planctomycetes bacterium]|nr:hypothetical protein [Planctomycetota bacterium]